MVNLDANTAIPEVKVNGAPLTPPQLARSIARVVVERQRNLPAMCEVEFLIRDGLIVMPPVADNPMMRPGAPLKVEAGPSQMDPTQTPLGALFDGEVVAVEATFTPEGGRRFLLRGYDKSHRMHRARKSRTFVMQSDNLIATSIGQEHGLTVIAEPAGGPHEYLCQRNQTDWEFLMERAREIGFELGMSALGQLLFRRAGADATAGVPQRLTLAGNLLSFRVRATSAEQATMTKAYSWNTMLKQQVMGLAAPPTGENVLPDPTLQALTIAARLGSSEDASVDIPVDLPPEAIANATAMRAHAASASIEAEGSCIGNPAMVPGGKISVSGVGQSFDGSYVLTMVRHVFDRNHEGGVTCFTVSGVHDRSLFGLTQPGAATRANGHGGGGANLGSAVVGVVSNTNDPLQRGRVKVELPWLGDSVEGHWAPVVSLGAGDGKGFQCIPEVHDQVLVVFEHGDVRRPYVLGGIYGPPTELPAPQVTAVMNGETKIRTFKTSAGHELTFTETDTPLEKSILIKSIGGQLIEIKDAPPANTITLRSGQNEIVIDGTQQTVTVKSAANLKIEATANLELQATGQLKLKGSTVDVEGTGPVKVKSGAALGLESVGIAELKGATVKIN
ncbi:MAG: VgrG-related protein [Actinobacteria bacterium]|nr:VgrG-related protein [Actinomycetota bacterium]